MVDDGAPMYILEVSLEGGERPLHHVMWPPRCPPRMGISAGTQPFEYEKQKQLYNKEQEEKKRNKRKFETSENLEKVYWKPTISLSLSVWTTFGCFHALLLIK